MKYNYSLAEEETKLFFKIKYENMIKKRKEDIIHAFKDDNLTTTANKSNVNYSRDEMIAIKLAEDNALKKYQDILRDITPIFDRLSYDDKRILISYYVNVSKTKHKRLSDKQVSNKLYIPLQNCREVRRSFVNEVARKRSHVMYD